MEGNAEVEWKGGNRSACVDLLEIANLVVKKGGKGVLGAGGGVGTVIVIEDFALYPGKVHTGGTSSSGLSPVFVTGFVMGMLSSAGYAGKYEFQMASAAKNAVTDERLRALGGWIVGKQHARDAFRHAELFSVKCGKSDPTC